VRRGRGVQLGDRQRRAHRDGDVARLVFDDTAERVEVHPLGDSTHRRAAVEPRAASNKSERAMLLCRFGH